MGSKTSCPILLTAAVLTAAVTAQPLCYTCLRPDSFNQHVDCWTDRKTAAVNCSLPEYRCVDHLSRFTPDFVSLRRNCQPVEALYNPCLFINGASLQVAGVQNYTVNDEPEKCLCFDVCDATSHAALFGSPDLPSPRQSEANPDTSTTLRSSAKDSSISTAPGSLTRELPETIFPDSTPTGLFVSSGFFTTQVSLPFFLFSVILVSILYCLV